MTNLLRYFSVSGGGGGARIPDLHHNFTHKLRVLCEHLHGIFYSCRLRFVKSMTGYRHSALTSDLKLNATSNDVFNWLMKCTKENDGTCIYIRLLHEIKLISTLATCQLTNLPPNPPNFINYIQYTRVDTVVSINLNYAK